MEGFARSKDVHRTLIRQWDPWLKENGFQRKRSDRCAYFRPDESPPGGLMAFEVQCSPWAMEWSGGMFTLNGGRGVKDARDLGWPHARLLMLLDESDLPEALEIQSRIVRRMPDIPDNHPVAAYASLPDPQGAQWREILAERKVPRTFRWEPGNDHWCDYFSVDDVEEWGRFLQPRILPLLHRIPLDPQ